MSKKWQGRSVVDRLQPSPNSLLSVTERNTKAVLQYILSHAKDDVRPYLKIKIFDKEFLALLDSGCSITVLGKYGWEVLKTFCSLKSSTPTNCTVANGEQCQIIGSITVPIQLRDRVDIFEVLVIPSLPHYVILGVDFWAKMNIIPDLNSGEWAFREEPLSTPSVVNAIETLEGLTEQERQELNKLIEDTFTKMGQKLGCTSIVEHEIRTNSSPIKQRHYPLSPTLQLQVNKELEQMLADDIIEPSSSPWASPIVLVKKPDGSYRFCVNYKKLNEVSLPDAYPLPFVANTLDKLRDAKYLSTIDLKSAYWQIPVAKESRPLTAFVVPTRGLFQFKRMPFGLHNSPATWQRFIDRVIGFDLEKHVFVYLDDIIICTPTFSKHLEVLREVFRRLLNAGLTMNRDKCQFCKPELKYLGYVVNASGLMVDPEKVEAILKIPTPSNVTEVRRIVGLASWYRRFVPNFSTIVAPITTLLRKNQRFCWDDNCEEALNAIKSHLVTAPILSCPNFDIPFSIQTDASDYGLGAVLTQMTEEGEKVICYLSRSLTKTERRFSVTEKECLAVLFAVEKLRPYIEGTKFTVITDHYSLKWLYSIKDPIGRIARWAVRLQQYDFEIIHRKGKDHVVPDALSRFVPEVSLVDGTAPKETVVDLWYSNMMRRVTNNPSKFPSWRTEGNHLYKHVDLPYQNLIDSVDEWRLVVPKENRKSVIKDLHDPPTSGHLGVSKTLHRIAARYYWPKMAADVRKYVGRCKTCLEIKSDQKAPIGHMASQQPTALAPWKLLSVDLVGPLPRTTAGNSYILSILDCFSKFILLFPLRTATASKVTQILEEQILLFGAPERIIVDNGVQFRSNVFKGKAQEYGIKLLFTANYHPQANPVERVHRVIKTMLSAYVKDTHQTWDKYLSKVAWALRSARHEVIGLEPNFVFFGRTVEISGFENRPTIQTNPVNNPQIRAVELKQVFKDVSDRLKKAFDKSRKVYNLRRRSDQFVVNQSVYRRNYVLSDKSQKFSSKLAPKYLGPFYVKKVLSPWSYELRDQTGKNCGVWHAKDIKAHPPDDSDSEEN